MNLYYSPGACSLSPHIMLRETRQVFELIRVDLAKHQLLDGSDYYQINPKGSVPVLEIDNSERLTEGPIISQYICDLAGRQDLMPATGTMARYRVLEWQNYITSELHKAFSPLFNPELQSVHPILRTALHKKLAWVSEQVTMRDYLTGRTFTAADSYLFTVLGWSKLVKLDIDDLNGLQRYLRRVAERPAVHEALKAEGLVA